MRAVAIALALCASGCGPMRSSMIGLDGMHARGVSIGVAGDTLVVEHDDPAGGALVMNDAYLDGDRVVLGALLTSSGGAFRRVDCVDVAALPRAPGWQERIYWRAPDGSLARVAEVTTVDAAACPR